MRFDFLKHTKTYCLAPAPLLFIFTNFFAIGAILFLIFLLFFLLIRSLIKKRRGLIVFDNIFKTICLFLITILIFLITFGYFYTDLHLYVISLLVMTIFLVVTLFLGKKFSLFRVRNIYLILAFVSLVLFITLSFINIFNAYKEQQEEVRTQQEKIEFEKMVLGLLPIRPDLKKEGQNSDSLFFLTSQNLSVLEDYYKTILLSLGWKLSEEERTDYYEAILFYKKINNEDKWIELSFSDELSRMKISVYNEKRPLSAPVFFPSNFLGTCGEFLWF